MNRTTFLPSAKAAINAGHALILVIALGASPALHAQGETEPVYVRMETSLGDMVLQLYSDKAPKTVENFLRYVGDGFYDDTVFHRVIGSFVIQGGGFTAEFEKKPTHEPITNEADNMLPNKLGTIAMARTNHPHSATSQFFINVNNNTALNHTGTTSSRAWGYTVFGEVIDGFDVMDAIRAVETGPGGPFPRDVPQEPVVIEAVTVLEGYDQTGEAEPAEAEAATGI